jgi:hypothetical protein
MTDLCPSQAGPLARVAAVRATVVTQRWPLAAIAADATRRPPPCTGLFRGLCVGYALEYD